MTSPLPGSESLRPIAVPDESASMHARLRHVAEALPDRLALAGPSGRYTYAELMDAVDATGRELLARLGDDDAPVGILMAHDTAAVITLLALVRIDRVFINLDPVAPPARTAAIVNGSGMRACIVDDPNAGVLAGVDVEMLRLTGDSDAGTVLPAPTRGGTDTLYLVFTSGSTGKPKGVSQTHVQTLNEAFIAQGHYDLTPADGVAAMYPLAFVMGVLYVFNPLAVGAAIHLVDARSGTPRHVLESLRAARATVALMTPHLLRALTQELREGERLEDVRAIATAGEAVMGRDLEAFSRHVRPDVFHVNVYGSSEATSTAVLRLPGCRAEDPGAVPAGRAVPTREIWILREDGSRADVGETGQVGVVARHLSGGYFRNPAATAEKFRPLPDGRTVYLQGDLGWLDESGVLRLGGRADTAVKVRGYLVDMSEIENALRDVPGVKEALALPAVEEGKPTRLVAYVAQAGDVRQASVAELRRILRAKLPEYMVPGTFVTLAEFPRNERGKIDRQALPQPVEAVVEVDDTRYSQHELVVQQLWANVLGLEKVPLDGDFMALGGDSLSVEEMLAEVESRTGIDIGSNELLAAPTLQEFARLLEQRDRTVRKHSDLAMLRTGDGRGRLFAFVGAGALALQFLPVARHLEGWDVVAFQAHGLEQRGKPDWSVEAHARRALTEIRRIQPHGPYRLAGHSFGGLIAYEIATQLVAAGEQVDLLALLDTYLPGSAGDELSVRTNFGRLADGEPATLAQRIADAIMPRRADQTLADMSFLRAAAVIARARTAGLLRYGGQRQFDTFFYQSVLAARRYRVRPYDGRALVITAPTNPVDREEWRKRLRGDVRFAEVASEHSAMLREPHAGELGAYLLKALEGAGEPAAV